MREIKFRAWDLDNNKMIHNALTLNNKYLDLYELRYHDFPIMQYTGEEDYEGREIYEDDVYSDFLGYLYQVIFNEGAFVLLHIPDPFNHRTVINLCNIWNFELDYEGNIHENPELLEIKL